MNARSSNTSRRRLHQDDYGRALAGADRVSLKVPEPHDKVPEAERLDVPALVAALEAAGVPATAAPDVETLAREVALGARSGDVLLVMSNGAFGGLIDRTLSVLADRARVGGEHR